MRQTILSLGAALLLSATAAAQNTPVSQMEKLNRGVVALPSATGSGNFVSWRFLGTDDEDNTRFDLYRNGVKIVSNIYKTNYRDASGTKTSTYHVVKKVGNEEVETSETATAWQELFYRIKLDRPAGGSTESGDYTYSPNDISVGDADGDGQYELYVKWDPSNSKDNSQNGYTGNVIIDCYKLDGTKLWRIDLGRNIRAGAHYTQFMVYDFDGDGKAEMMCKTAPGSKDSKGNYVNQAATDENIKKADNTKVWLSSSGRMDGGQEYLTVFNADGEAVHTIAYNPNRNATSALSEAQGTFNWAVGKTDTHGYNRGDRYLAAVAYLDGPDRRPSGVFSRGYYTYAFIWAVDFDGKELHQKWLHSSREGTKYTVTTYDADGKGTAKTFSNLKPTSGSGSGTMYGNGNHNLSVADVDGDGCDEIIWGSAALNNDGTLLYGTGFGHGDAIHLADHCPDRPGLEVFQIHEEGGPYAWDLHDAATGEVLLKGGPAGVDNGRGMCAQFDANVRGSLFWSSSDGTTRSAVTGEAVSANHGSSNFRIYWDGDLQEELFDGGKIDKWNGNGTSRVYLNGKNIYDYNSSSTCNGTKSTPNLQADILGDWREELILWSANDNCTLNVFTTNTETPYRIPTLMHDHTYRMGVAWQNVAYNQPPHLGYYLPDAMFPVIFTGNKELTVNVGEEIDELYRTRFTNVMTQTFYVSLDNPGAQIIGLPDGLTKIANYTDRSLQLTGAPTTAGDYGILLYLTGMGSERVTDTLKIHVIDRTDGIDEVPALPTNGHEKAYDLQGRRRSTIDKGLFLERRGDRYVKVMK